MRTCGYRVSRASDEEEEEEEEERRRRRRNDACGYRQGGDTGERREWEVNENRLPGVLFNNKEFCSRTNLVDYAGQHTQRGLAFAWRQSRTRKRSRCQGSGGGLGPITPPWFSGTRATVSSYRMQRQSDVCGCVRGVEED
jgi:hypothetical protein